MTHGDDEDDGPVTAWSLQPLWSKVLIVCVGVLAGLWHVWQMFGDDGFSEPSLTPFYILLPVSLVSTFYVLRAYWRMEL